MKWQNYISSDPGVLLGRPVIKGTRIAVGYILDLLGKGWTEQQILDNYPSISSEAMRVLSSFKE